MIHVIDSWPAVGTDLGSNLIAKLAADKHSGRLLQRDGWVIL